MSTTMDGQVTWLKETTFNTPVTPSRAIEVLADSQHSFDPMAIQGQGLRVSSQYARTARRLAGTGRGEVTLKFELTSKGMGTLFEMAAGTSESTLVSASTYQQRHRPVRTVPFGLSSTIQFGVPRVDSAGTVDAYTYSGCSLKTMVIDAPDMESLPTCTLTFWAASLATATALVIASYPATPTLYTPVGGTTTLGGTLTAPTTTALATGGTTVTNVRGWTLTVDVGLDERPRLGGWQQPATGAPKATLKVKQDYDATTLRDALKAQTALSFSGSFIGGALSTGTERFELDIPSMYADQDAFGQITNGDPSVPDITFMVTDNLTDAPWYIVQRTADNAL